MMAKLSFLFDTNILIPAEPTSVEDLSLASPKVARLIQAIQETGHRYLIHPAVYTDIQRDKNVARKDAREVLLGKYERLTLPNMELEIPASFITNPTERDNNWVDVELLKSLYHHLYSFLVTEDRGIHAKAKRLEISEKVLFIDDAIEFLGRLYPVAPSTGTNIESIHPGDLDLNEPMFTSLKEDYLEFRDWYRNKVVPDSERKVYVTKSRDDNAITGLAILKPEDSVEYGPKGKTLKICTFKVSGLHGGRRFGELLIKTVLDYASINQFEFCYLTVFPKHGALIDFLETFGFYSVGQNAREELIYCKAMIPSPDDFNSMHAMDFNIKYGPFACNENSTAFYLIPIQDDFHKILFPELEPQIGLFNDQPSGNSIRKSYLCHSNTKSIAQGDLVFFYRSGPQAQMVQSVGIVESTQRISDLLKLTEFVGNRTIFSMERLTQMVQKPVLAINFRLVKLTPKGIESCRLEKNQVYVRPPQSIMKLKKEKAQWIRAQIEI